MKSVTFQFVLPSQNELWKTKPTRFIGDLLGHEGDGSVLSVLKQKNLALALSAGLWFDEAGVCLFAIDVHVTDKGHETGLKEIGNVLFAYINLLQKKFELAKAKDKDLEDLEGIWKEIIWIEQMGFKFRSLPGPEN